MSDAIRNLQVALSLDVSQFSQSVKAVNQHIRDLDNKFKNASSQTKNFENSFTGLSTKIDYLKGKITATQEKIKLLTQEQKENTDKLNVAKQAYDNAKATWQDSVNTLNALKASGKATTDEIAKQEQEVQKNHKAMLAAEKGYQRLTDKNKTLDRQLGNSKTALKNMETSLTEASQKFANLQNNTETTNDKLRKLNASVPLLESKMKLLTSQLGLNATASDKLKVSEQNLATKITLVSQKIALLKTKSGELASAKGSLQGKARDLQRELLQEEAALQKATSATNVNEKEVAELSLKILQLKDKLRSTNAAIDETTNDINQNNTALNNAQAEFNQLSTEVAKTKGQIAALPFDTLSTKLASMSSTLRNVGQGFISVGSCFNRYITAPIVAVGAVSLKTAIDFEQGMKEVQTISGATAEELVLLSEKAKYMGATTKFTAIEASEAFNYMAMAGWTTSQMLDGIEGIMNLAAASAEDLGTVSDICTDALTAFGLAAGDSAMFADVLARASADTNTNVAMMGETFKYVAPVAGALGFSVQDTAVAIGLMANAGIKSSMAGTSLRKIMSSLGDGVEITGKKLGEYTIETVNADGSMRDFHDILVDLRHAFSQLSESEAMLAAESIGGKTAMAGLLTIVQATDDDFNKLTKSVNNCAGASKEMADMMLDTANGDIVMLKSKLEALAIHIGDKLVPILIKCVDKISEMADWFGNLSDEQQESIMKWAALAAAIGPVLIFIGKVSIGLSSLLKAGSFISGGIGKIIGKMATAQAATTATTATINGVASTATATASTFSKIAPLLVNPWVAAGVAIAGGAAVVITQTKKLEKFTEESTEKTRKLVANLEEDYEKSFTSMSNSIDKLTGKNIKFVSDEDKILLQKDLKDVESIIKGGSGNAEKEMSEYINRVVKYLPKMSKKMQTSTAEGIKLMLETFAKDGKITAEKAEELWNNINDKLKKPLDGLNMDNIKQSLKMQDLFKNFSKDLADSKGWGSYSKLAGDWDQTVTSLNKMIKASKDVKAEDVPTYVNNLIGAMKNSEVPAELMSHAFSKSMTSALEAFGPTGASAYFKQFVNELGLGATDVETTISNMAGIYNHLPEQQKLACDTLLSDLLSHYGYIDEMTIGFNEDMLSQSSEMWSSIVGTYLSGTDNAQATVGAFVTDAIENIKYMSDTNKTKSVEWLSTYLNKMVETGALTVGEAHDMATKINKELGQEVVTKVGINPDKFYAGYMKAQGDVKKLDTSQAAPKFTADVNKFQKSNTETIEALKKTNGKSATPIIKADNTDAIKKINAVDTKLKNLKSEKTITIKVNEITKKTTVSATAPKSDNHSSTSSNALETAQTFGMRTFDLFDNNLSDINDRYLTSGSFYNRNTSSISQESSSRKIEKLLLDAINKIATGKEYTQNITINSAKQLSPREIAQQTRLAGQQLLKLY